VCMHKCVCAFSQDISFEYIILSPFGPGGLCGPTFFFSIFDLNKNFVSLEKGAFVFCIEKMGDIRILTRVLVE